MWGCDSESAGKETTELLTGKIENVVEPTTAISTDGKDAALVVFTANKAWNVRTEKTWCKATPASGKEGESITVAITAEANNSYDERNSNITITCGDAVKHVTVAQKQKDAILLTSNKVEAKQEGEEIKVEVRSNVDLQVK